MIILKTYQTAEGKIPFNEWLTSLKEIVVLLLYGSNKSKQKEEIDRAIAYLKDWRERGDE